MEANESDFCDRLPGQHLGRLSLELQASEAAEWQEIVDMLATRVRNLEAAVNKLKASPAAGESPGISPEPAQAHGLTPPATPSAAVGASGPGAGDHKEWCDGAKETYERQVESDTVPRSEYDRVVKLNHHLREAAVMAITEMVPTDSKPTNCHNPESEDTPPHNPVLGPVVGTAKVSLRDWCQKSSGTRFPDPSPPLENDVPVSDTVQPEVGKRYVCRNGEVTKPMQCKQRSPCYPFMTEVGPKDVLKTWTETGRHDLYRNGPLPYDLVAEYHDPEPSPPAESPDDWVMLTDPDHVIRKCDQISDYGTQWYGPSDLTAALGKQYKNCGFKLVRCRRKDMPPVPVVPPPLPSPWRPMTDDYPRDKVLWVARDDGLVYTERNPDEWPLAKAIAWMLAVTPVHPNAAPPAVPKTRTVTLRECTTYGEIYWTTNPNVRVTGRTCQTEVPE